MERILFAVLRIFFIAVLIVSSCLRHYLSNFWIDIADIMVIISLVILFVVIMKRAKKILMKTDHNHTSSWKDPSTKILIGILIGVVIGNVVTYVMTL